MTSTLISMKYYRSKFSLRFTFTSHHQLRDAEFPQLSRNDILSLHLNTMNYAIVPNESLFFFPSTISPTEYRPTTDCPHTHTHTQLHLSLIAFNFQPLMNCMFQIFYAPFGSALLMKSELIFNYSEITFCL